MPARDDQFRELHRLLALKRHEQPPPGFFDRLPPVILHRIRTQPQPDPASWLQALLDHLELKPALASAFGLALATAYVMGLGLTERDVNEAAFWPALPADTWHASSPPANTAHLAGFAPPLVGHPAWRPASPLSSMSPWVSPAQSTFYVPLGNLHHPDLIQPAAATFDAR